MSRQHKRAETTEVTEDNLMLTRRSLFIATVIISSSFVTGCSDEESQILSHIRLDINDKEKRLDLSDDEMPIDISAFGYCTLNNSRRQVVVEFGTAVAYGLYHLKVDKLRGNVTDSNVAATVDGNVFKGSCAMSGHEFETEDNAPKNGWEVSIQFDQCPVTYNGMNGSLSGTITVTRCSGN
ncbi:MAG TPA: hypothetical protein VE093_29730 [Polyangiaceae bacterium]|nr:hypothetical protein [Polyangiaceae bacterium]